MSVKNRFKPLLCAALFLAILSGAEAQNFRIAFGDDYGVAEKMAEKNRPLLIKYSRDSHEDWRFLEAVIFPELIRYNKVYDYFETASLIALYARLGSSYNDFSIGFFQMKPSFAFSLEKYSRRLRSAWVLALGFDKLDIADNFTARLDRVKRLKDPEWQVKYLIAFKKSFDHLHHMQGQPSTASLKITATAFNAGWQHNTESLATLGNKKYFHVSRWKAVERYSYAAISLYRYEELLQGK